MISFKEDSATIKDGYKTIDFIGKTLKSHKTVK